MSASSAAAFSRSAAISASTSSSAFARRAARGLFERIQIFRRWRLRSRSTRADVLGLVCVDGLVHLFSEFFKRRSPDVFVDARDDELREVEHTLQASRRDVEQQADAARRALHEPNVRDGRRELDVAHALAAYLRAGDLHAALVADDALVADALVLAAVALEVLGRPEDLLAEEAVLLRLERPVVDRLRLRNLTVGPGTHLLRRGERYSYRVEVVNFESQLGPPLSRIR